MTMNAKITTITGSGEADPDLNPRRKIEIENQKINLVLNLIQETGIDRQNDQRKMTDDQGLVIKRKEIHHIAEGKVEVNLAVGVDGGIVRERVVDGERHMKVEDEVNLEKIDDEVNLGITSDTEVDHVIDEVDNEAKTGLHHVTSIEHENKVKRDQKTTGIISLDQGHVTETSKVISHTAREIDIVIRLGRRHVMEIENTVTRRDHKQQTGIINMDRNRMQINRNIDHLHRNIVMIKEGSVNQKINESLKNMS
jgi:hypothetical protein